MFPLLDDDEPFFLPWVESEEAGTNVSLLEVVESVRDELVDGGDASWVPPEEDFGREHDDRELADGVCRLLAEER